MAILLTLDSIDMKCQHHQLEAGAVLLNQSDCDPKTSFIHQLSEKRGSLVYKYIHLSRNNLINRRGRVKISCCVV